MRVTTVALAAGLSAIAACGGGGDSGTTTPPPPATVQSVSLSKSSALIEPSETVTISATPRDAGGNPLSGKTVSWAVTPSTGTVTLTPNNASVTITGSAAGQASVTATVDQVTSAPMTVTVSTTIPSSASVAVGSGGDTFTPSQTDIKAGGTVTYSWAAGPHNVTFVSPPSSVPNSGDQTSGFTFPVTFTTAGTYDYQCTIHPGMRGTITVHP